MEQNNDTNYKINKNKIDILQGQALFRGVKQKNKKKKRKKEKKKKRKKEKMKKRKNEIKKK